jgi:hypothetical protein
MAETQIQYSVSIWDALIGILLPSLAIADVEGFWGVIEGQIWGTASDSPVHLGSLKTILRVVAPPPPNFWLLTLKRFRSNSSCLSLNFLFLCCMRFFFLVCYYVRLLLISQ